MLDLDFNLCRVEDVAPRVAVTVASIYTCTG